MKMGSYRQQRLSFPTIDERDVYKRQVYEVLYENREPSEALDALFTRSLKNEF